MVKKSQNFVNVVCERPLILDWLTASVMVSIWLISLSVFLSTAYIDKMNDPSNCVLVHCDYFVLQTNKNRNCDELVHLKPFIGLGPNEDKQMCSR